MPENIEAQIQTLLDQGHSQRSIAKELHISRTTVGRIVQKLQSVEVHREGTPEKGVHKSTPEQQQTGTPQQVYPGTPILRELTESWDDLKALLVWWKERKRAPSIARDADRETQRQTYHVQKRYIEAIKRAADLERVSIMEIVNRAFRKFFDERA
jgi:hypothetical protein